MTKALIKKQMMEVFSFFWQDRKHNRIRTGSKLVVSVVLYLLLFAFLAAMFAGMAILLCGPLAQAGLSWLYFALMGLVGVALGAFGSVFNTYSGLYQAKDNSLLLAMPIRPRQLLVMRLSGVYAMGLLYELLVMVPTLIVYYIVARPGALAVLLSLLVTVILSFFVLTLSTALGFVVALVAARTRHKSILTVLISLVFIAVYYYFCMRVSDILQVILSNPQVTGDFIRGTLYPVYQMGMAAQGDPVAFLIFAAMVLGLFALVCLVLSRTYLRLVTANRGEAKKAYKERRAKAGSAGSALFRKELRRFLGSPNYMLNCGLGVVFMLVGAVALLIKGGDIVGLLAVLGEDYAGQTALMVCAAICLIASMTDISAPSVSLEGKNLWLVQSLPVSGWQALAAKLKLHLVFALPPTLLLTLCTLWVLRPSPAFALLIPAVAVLFVVVMAQLGLFVNLLAPNLTWTSEIVPIKQSLSVSLALFGGWGIVLLLGGIYFLLRKLVSPLAYLAVLTVLLLAAAVLLFLWLKNRGARIFERL